jgi:hypothetical protein
LQAVLRFESFLQRMEVAVSCHTFDGENLVPVRLHRKRGARFDRLAIKQHRARAAIGGVATDMRPRQRQYLADEVHEEEPGLDVCGVLNAVYLNANSMLIRHRDPPPAIYDFRLLIESSFQPSAFSKKARPY